MFTELREASHHIAIALEQLDKAYGKAESDVERYAVLQCKSAVAASYERTTELESAASERAV